MVLVGGCVMMVCVVSCFIVLLVCASSGGSGSECWKYECDCLLGSWNPWW